MHKQQCRNAPNHQAPIWYRGHWGGAFKVSLDSVCEFFCCFAINVWFELATTWAMWPLCEVLPLIGFSDAHCPSSCCCCQKVILSSSHRNIGCRHARNAQIASNVVAENIHFIVPTLNGLGDASIIQTMRQIDLFQCGRVLVAKALLAMTCFAVQHLCVFLCMVNLKRKGEIAEMRGQKKGGGVTATLLKDHTVAPTSQTHDFQIVRRGKAAFASK